MSSFQQAIRDSKIAPQRLGLTEVFSLTWTSCPAALFALAQSKLI
jgi:hypothetical protein